MLFFLAIAARRGFVVDSYVDEAVGVMSKNAEGRIAMTRVALRPVVRWSGDKRPAPADIDAIHRQLGQDRGHRRAAPGEISGG